MKEMYTRGDGGAAKSCNENKKENGGTGFGRAMQGFVACGSDFHDGKLLIPKAEEGEDPPMVEVAVGLQMGRGDARDKATQLKSKMKDHWNLILHPGCMKYGFEDDLCYIHPDIKASWKDEPPLDIWSLRKLDVTEEKELVEDALKRMKQMEKQMENELVEKEWDDENE